MIDKNVNDHQFSHPMLTSSDYSSFDTLTKSIIQSNLENIELLHYSASNETSSELSAEPSIVPTSLSNQTAREPSAYKSVKSSELSSYILSDVPTIFPTQYPTSDITDNTTQYPANSSTATNKSSTIPTSNTSKTPSTVLSRKPSSIPSPKPSPIPCLCPTSRPPTSKSTNSVKPSIVLTNDPAYGLSLYPVGIPQSNFHTLWSSTTSTNNTCLPSSNPTSHPTTLPTTPISTIFPSFMPSLDLSSVNPSISSTSQSNSPTFESSFTPSTVISISIVPSVVVADMSSISSTESTNTSQISPTDLPLSSSPVLTHLPSSIVIPTSAVYPAVSSSAPTSYSPTERFPNQLALSPSAVLSCLPTRLSSYPITTTSTQSLTSHLSTVYMSSCPTSIDLSSTVSPSSSVRTTVPSDSFESIQPTSLSISYNPTISESYSPVSNSTSSNNATSTISDANNGLKTLYVELVVGIPVFLVALCLIYVYLAYNKSFGCIVVNRQEESDQKSKTPVVVEKRDESDIIDKSVELNSVWIMDMSDIYINEEFNDDLVVSINKTAAEAVDSDSWFADIRQSIIGLTFDRSSVSTHRIDDSNDKSAITRDSISSKSSVNTSNPMHMSPEDRVSLSLETADDSDNSSPNVLKSVVPPMKNPLVKSKSLVLSPLALPSSSI